MELKTIKLPFSIQKPTLALGSQTKNTVCFIKGNTAYVSGVHADLSNPQDYLQFEKVVKYFLKLKPKVIVCDMHPDYVSTKYGGRISKYQNIRISGIQHHHAHIASCMAENSLKNQLVIGVAFDGTGLGSDGSIWGAEFLVCDYKNFQRIAHLKEIALIGADRAIQEPWRLLAALNLEKPEGIDKTQWQLVKNMQAKGFNTIMASSMGRIFDAAAVLILEKYRANFEAELAIKLQRLAFNFERDIPSYAFKIIKDKDGFIVDPLLMFKGIKKDFKAKVSRTEIAYRVHLTVAEMIKKTCLILRKKHKINKVVLSGGVFQNNLLLRLSLDLLYRENFEFFLQKELSCNDSGISLGQAIIAGTGG